MGYFLGFIHHSIELALDFWRYIKSRNTSWGSLREIYTLRVNSPQVFLIIILAYCWFGLIFLVYNAFSISFVLVSFSGELYRDLATDLQEAHVNVYTKKECTEEWGSTDINDGHVCVGDSENGRAACGVWLSFTFSFGRF